MDLDKKIKFRAMNHANPYLNPESGESNRVLANGYNIAGINAVLEL